MKNKLFKFSLLIAALFAIETGCSKLGESVPESGKARVKFSFTNNHNQVVVGTRADDTIYRVDILNESGVIVQSYENHKEIGDGISIAAGTYTFRASYGENKDAAFESPYYEGNTTLTLSAGRDYTVGIECFLANVRVSVTTSDLIKESFPVFNVSVSSMGYLDDRLDPNYTLLFDYETEAAAKSGYYKSTGVLHYEIYLKNNNGTESTIKRSITGVEPRDHYKLNFSIDPNNNDNGGVSIIDVVVDDELNEKNYDFVVNPNPEDAPQVGGGDHDLSQPIVFEEGAEIELDITLSAKSPIYSITVAHTSDYIASLGIPKSFDPITVDASTEATINQAGLSWTLSNTLARSGIEGDIHSVELHFSDLLKTLPENTYDFSLTVEDQLSQKTSQAVTITVTEAAPPVLEVSISAGDQDGWARFAYLTASWTTDARPEGLGFKYKASGATEWSTVAGSDISFSDGQFRATATHLEPNTEYQVKAFSGTGAETEPVSFTTETEAQFLNMGFEDWASWKISTILGSKTVLFPSADDGDGYCWDSGNGGGALASIKPTTQETSFVYSGNSAAKLESISKTLAFAAGSLYTGAFGSATLNPVGAKLNFGRPYTSRPARLTGYYSYQPGTIDNDRKDKYPHLKGTTDEMNIYVLLADWDQPFQVSTGDGIFIDFEGDEKIIAYGEFHTSEANPDAYKKFVIDLVYRSDRKPTYGVIVATSSRYGDYFTGSGSSVLYVDEFNLEFDPEGVKYQE